MIYKENNESKKYKFGRFYKLLNGVDVELKCDYKEELITTINHELIFIPNESFYTMLSMTSNNKIFIERPYHDYKMYLLQSITQYFNDYIHLTLFNDTQKINFLSVNYKQEIIINDDLNVNTLTLIKTSNLDQKLMYEESHIICVNLKKLFIENVDGIKINTIDVNEYNYIHNDFTNFLSCDIINHMYNLIVK